MAGLAPCLRAAGSYQLHAFLELTFVGIGVAIGTAQIFPMVYGSGFRLELR
jgi:hypothetical protein